LLERAPVVAAFAAALFALAVPVHAQIVAQPRYAAGWSAAWHLPLANNSNIGSDRTLLVADVERRVVLATGRLGAIAWSPALLAANATHNMRLDSRSCDRTGTYNTVDIMRINGACYAAHAYSAFGLGVVPLAFRWQVGRERRLGVAATLDGGGVLFNHPLPVTSDTHLRGQSFNFVARGGGDVVLRVTRGAWLSAGYRHVHLSNGGLGSINPGIDADLLALGVAWR
jgi:hypothetical protein